MLHQRVGEIFLENESASARAAFSTSLERFLVPDRGTEREELEVVLLVESPHTTEISPPEINDRYPLAGDTENFAGRRVTDKFVECARELDLPQLALPPQSIGSIVHQGRGTAQHLGIMNVSQLPFQCKAYRRRIVSQRKNDCRNHERWDNYIDHMRIIRTSRCEGNRRDANCRRLDDAIAIDLRLRLDCLHIRKPNVQLVCCGGVAREFYWKAINRPPVCSIHRPPPCNLPHPSHSSWQTRNCQDACLRNILGRLRPAPP